MNAKKLLALSLACTLTLGLSACGGGQDAPSSGSPSGASDGDALKVGIILSTGGLGDKNFNDMTYAGAQQAEKDFGIEFDYVETQSASDFLPNYRMFAESGEYDLIIGSGFDGVEAVTKVSGLFPEQQFMFVDGDCGDLPNVASFTFRDQEKAFLLGYLAAQTSETGKIGVVGGMDIPSINMFVAGYEAGAAYAGNGTTVERKYVGAWNDTSTGKELALALYDSGCDIVYQAAGGSGLGVFAAAAEKDLLAIGSDTNQCLIDPDHVFASGIRTLNYIIRDGILSGKAGTLEPGSHSVGLAENGVTYTCEGSNVAVPQEVIDSVEAVKQEIIDGKLTVPSTLDDVASFIETYCNK